MLIISSSYIKCGQFFNPKIYGIVRDYINSSKEGNITKNTM